MTSITIYLLEKEENGRKKRDSSGGLQKNMMPVTERRMYIEKLNSTQKKLLIFSLY